MDINAIIQTAKLGSSRKDAQVDCCCVFAAALYDVLTGHGIACQMVTAVNKTGPGWAHMVVRAGGRLYDSVGEFSTAIYHARSKTHKSVTLQIEYRKDVRRDCYDSEYDVMYSFFVKALRKAICKQKMALEHSPTGSAEAIERERPLMSF